MCHMRGLDQSDTHGVPLVRLAAFSLKKRKLQIVDLAIGSDKLFLHLCGGM